MAGALDFGAQQGAPHLPSSSTARPSEGMGVIETFQLTTRKHVQTTQVPPNDKIRVFPLKLIDSARKTAGKQYLTIPDNGHRHPMITLNESGDFDRARADGKGFKAYFYASQRVVACLQTAGHYVNNPAPAQLCLNCFVMHETVCPCPDLQRDWQGLIDACASRHHNDPYYYDYPDCNICGRKHPPVHGDCRRQRM